jgi:acyl-CoA reductase-like NAD-dependent aldehyde dehydrogenase
MRIAQEEIFGPVVSVIPYKDDEEAIRIANDSMYGLGGAVWSKNEDRALSVARQIQTGTVWINDYHLINVRFPFGGYKQSGVGRELGPWGLHEYQEVKHIHVGQDVPADQKIYFAALFN